MRPSVLIVRAWRALVAVLASPAPPLAWTWRSARERLAAYAAVAMITLGLVILNVAQLHGVAELHGTLPPPNTTSDVPPTLGQQLLALIVVAPLPLALWYPMLAWRAGVLALLLSPVVPAAWWGGWPWGPPQMLALLAAFCLAGLRFQRPELVLMWLITLFPWCLWLVVKVPHLNGPASATVVFLAVAIAMDGVGSRMRSQLALAAQTKRTEAERAGRAVLAERTRIARELHDVVAHHMSLIAVRAETAPYRLPGLPEPAVEEFGSLSETAREALADMRRLLGVLRDDSPAALAPQPRLADLPTLVDAARQAGVQVELSAPSSLAEVPSGVGVCAYRIVQESLSNASQHAPGAVVCVDVSCDPAAVRLRVANGPAETGVPRGPADLPSGPDGQPGAPGRVPADGHRPGHGLTGMRERVLLLRGSLSAGPAPGGGFVVSAVLPLGDTA